MAGSVGRPLNDCKSFSNHSHLLSKLLQPWPRHSSPSYRLLLRYILCNASFLFLKTVNERSCIEAYNKPNDHRKFLLLLDWRGGKCCFLFLVLFLSFCFCLFVCIHHIRIYISNARIIVAGVTQPYLLLILHLLSIWISVFHSLSFF